MYSKAARVKELHYFTWLTTSRGSTGIFDRICSSGTPLLTTGMASVFYASYLLSMVRFREMLQGRGVAVLSFQISGFSITDQLNGHQWE